MGGLLSVTSKGSKLFSRLSVQGKILASFAAVVVLMGVAIMLSLRALSSSFGDTSELYNKHVKGLTMLVPAQEALLVSAQKMQGAFVAVTPQQAEGDVLVATQKLSSAKESLTQFKTLTTDEQELRDIDAILLKMDALEKSRTAILAYIKAGDMANALKLNQEGGTGLDGVGYPAANSIAIDAADRIKKMTETKATTTAAIYTSAEGNASSAKVMVTAVAIVAAVFGIGIAYLTARGVRKGVRQVVDRLDTLANTDTENLKNAILAVEQGDLTTEVAMVTIPVANPGHDEIGQAAKAINAMIDKFGATSASYNSMRAGLQEMVRNVQENANEILKSSDQLREASDQMAGATGQIASAINEVTRSAVSLSSLSQDSAREVERVAAGSQELAATAGSSAHSASESKAEATAIGERITNVSNASLAVADAAEKSRVAAAEGKQSVDLAINSMDAISRAVERAAGTVNKLGEYGKQIGEIVKVIDEIASQTNLLALNAAIEAARAGEQGRGFAVVADSVRGLAERSSASTKEIATLIAKVQSGTREAVEAMNLGVRDVTQGREITALAGTALESIIGSVQHSAGQMKQIATDVRDLSSAAERIVATAQNLATMADQSASGAREMAEGTGRVTEAILQVSATSEQTSATAEEVSATTEELAAQSEELAATATQMKSLADALAQSAARFRIA